MHRRGVGVLATAALVAAAPLRPAASQGADRGPRVTFFLARYASPTFYALYAGYGAGSWQGVVGLVENSRTEYWEALLGLAKGLTLGPGQTMTTALAVARASDSRYVQLYLVPSLAAGRIALDVTVEIYAPIQRQGSFQYYLSPLSLRLGLTSRFQLGGTYLLAGQQGTTTGHALGPGVRVVVPHGAVTLDWVLGLTAYRNQTRLQFQTSL